MLILTVKSFDLEELTLRNPETSDGVMFCDPVMGNDPLYVQTPRMTFEETPSGIRLLFDNPNRNNSTDINTFYGMVRDIETRVCEVLAAKSGDWFSSETRESRIPLDTIKNSLFRNCIQLPMRIGEPLSMIVGVPLLPNGDRDIEVFDTSRREKSYEDLLASRECTFLLTVRELSISSTQANLVWEVVQVLTHTAKKKVKGFGIRTETPEYDRIDLGIFSNTKKVEHTEDAEQVAEQDAEQDAEQVQQDDNEV